MPPHEIDLELAWQFVPEEWGNGYATEAAAAVATWAFERSAHEVFAVMRPANAASERLARRLGMQWVGETDKYYDLGSRCSGSARPTWSRRRPARRRRLVPRAASHPKGVRRGLPAR